MYRVRRDDVECAMKVFTGPDEGGQMLAAFRREAVLLAGVDHPGLPVVHEVGEVDGHPYLVLDLITGIDLAEMLCGGPLSPERTVRLGIQVAQVLGAAHRAGLVHGDVKPANILIQEDGRARVTGFGLAARPASAESLRVRAEASAESLRFRAEASAESLRVRAEASAESLRVGADAVDARADLYSLGGVMAECVAGRRPVAPPSTVPPGLAGVIAKLLAEEPADRYQSCAGLIADLGILAAAPDATPVLGRFDEPAGQRRQV
ncbi:MAG: eukaryotic-like serine/threonine-protein kinase, partial [Micromonosporaceae bacterium]